MLTVAATAVALGLSSASASAPAPDPGPPLPAAAPGQTSDGKVFDPAVFRQAKTETLFTAVTPCRIADTRKGGGALANLAVRSFAVRGTTAFPAQGGTTGGCGIPASATAIASNVTVVGGAGSGYLSGYPAGAAEPTTNFVSYQRGANVTANPVLPLAATGPATQLSIRNHGAPVNVIVDVTGYYAPQIQGLIDITAKIPYSGSTRVLSVTQALPGVFKVKVDSDVTNCTPTVTPDSGVGIYASAYAFNGDIVTVFTWKLGAGGAPAVYDPLYFYLTVTC